MKVEYVCVVTMDQRDISLAAGNGGRPIEHPVAPVKTIIRVMTQGSEKPEAHTTGWRKSASEPV